MDPAAVVVIIVVLILLVNLRARREHLRHELSRLLRSAAVAAIAYGIAIYAQAPPSTALAVTALFGAIAFTTWPKRSRYPRAAARRRTIAKWELETGKKFNPRRHEVDHTIPFAQGGSNTEDNLQVVEKSVNRSKGARSPFWDLLGRR